jgi:ABC-type nickel/cobalt efflux system permease component RcnA
MDGFGLIIGFTGLLDTTRDYILLFTDTHAQERGRAHARAQHTHTHIYTPTHVHSHVFTTGAW